eukprot:scaffold128501_cov32-Tisochrysis_lutea.AAC.3
MAQLAVDTTAPRVHLARGGACERVAHPARERRHLRVYGRGSAQLSHSLHKLLNMPMGIRPPRARRMRCVWSSHWALPSGAASTTHPPRGPARVACLHVRGASRTCAPLSAWTKPGIERGAVLSDGRPSCPCAAQPHEKTLPVAVDAAEWSPPAASSRTRSPASAEIRAGARLHLR